MSREIPSLVAFSSAYLFIVSGVGFTISFTTIQTINRDLQPQKIPVIGGVILLVELLFMLFISFLICLPSVVTGLGLLKKKKWSRISAGLIFAFGLIFSIYSISMNSEVQSSSQIAGQATSLSASIQHYSFFNILCLMLGLYSMGFDRKVNRYFMESD